MTDVFTRDVRSQVMARIKSSGNKTTRRELAAIFRNHHMAGWRRNQKLLGKPDFVLGKHRGCVFANGCFWHGCPKYYHTPTSNVAYWASNVDRNRERKLLVSKTLKSKGWRILRVWEHELVRAILLRRLRRWLVPKPSLG